jgi:ribosomal protein L37AE/L43A
MTADEITALRSRIDQARREQLGLARLCAYCGDPIPPERVGRGKWKARYCSTKHRKYAWRQTEAGRAHERQAWRRRWEKIKQQREAAA